MGDVDWIAMGLVARVSEAHPGPLKRYGRGNPGALRLPGLHVRKSCHGPRTQNRYVALTR